MGTVGGWMRGLVAFGMASCLLIAAVSSADGVRFRRPVGVYDAGRPFPWSLDSELRWDGIEGYWTNVNGPLIVMKIDVLLTDALGTKIADISQVNVESNQTEMQRLVSVPRSAGLISTTARDKEGINWTFRLRSLSLQRSCGNLKGILVTAVGNKDGREVFRDNLIFRRIFDLDMNDVEEPGADCSMPSRYRNGETGK
jgi:hypothetical protein